MVYALRMALRQFRLHPAFAVVTILVLALGTGAATVVYTIVDAVVLQPLPYPAPDRLVKFWDTNVEKGLQRDPFSPVTFLDYKALPVFSGAAAWWRPDVNLVDPGLEPARVRTIETSGNLFAVLGVSPQLGPGFPADGPLFSTDLVVVISDRLWRTRYAGDTSIIGRPLSLNGVLPRAGCDALWISLSRRHRCLAAPELESGAARSPGAFHGRSRAGGRRHRP